MSKRNKREPPARFLTPSGNWNEHHLILFDTMLESDAFVKLSPQAVKLLLYIYEQYKGIYSGDTVMCPYSYLERRGFRHASIPRYIKELERSGFIKVISGGLYRQPNKYKLIGSWFQSQG